ncbi:RNase MRP subunit [Cladophialophora chaetospira]|uniref:RNase MRP subunit n=1 Tax=Cladophialophora chaetospira TaxID=386627 RepID=A0AA38XEW8_9EURO|nr:RNase MRP subunit [Cladophialophora chaetospira]
MVEATQTGSKRRKLSHSISRQPPQGGFRSNEKTKTGAVSNKRVRPKPPRAIRPPRRTVQNLTSNPGASSKVETARPVIDPPTADSSGTVTSLSFVKTLLDKIWARNKNQHRMQPWWKTLSMLRKAITRLWALESEEQLLLTQAQAPGSTANARDVRKRFERETQLRGEQEVWRNWLREVLVPRAYLSFSGLVGDVQFANLGVVLMGLLADVVSVVGSPTSDEGSDDGAGVPNIGDTRTGGGDFASSKARTLLATSLTRTGLQSGELVERQYDSDDLGEVIERKLDDQVARQKQVTGADDADEGTNILFNSVESTERDVEGRPSKEERRTIVDEMGERTKPPKLHLAHGKSEMIGYEVGGGKHRLYREPGKTKPGKSVTKSKKRKNKIDDLFAGLT